MEKEIGNLNAYLEHLEFIKKYSPHTLRAYRQDIEQYIEYFTENKMEVSRDNIRDFVSYIFYRSKKRATVQRKIYALKSFYGYLVTQGKMEKNPFDVISTPKSDKKLPEILTETEMTTFLERLPEGTYNEIRNKAIFEFLYATGLRISELANLTASDIDFSEGLVRVMGKGKKERIVPFNEHSGRLLQRYMEVARSEFKKPLDDVFLTQKGKKMSERGIRRILHDTYQRLMETNKNVYPHLFRHSFATHLLQRGANLRVIQELLGHSSLSTTEKYTNLNYSDLLNVYKRFHPRS